MTSIFWMVLSNAFLSNRGDSLVFQSPPLTTLQMISQAIQKLPL